MPLKLLAQLYRTNLHQNEESSETHQSPNSNEEIRHVAEVSTYEDGSGSARDEQADGSGSARDEQADGSGSARDEQADGPGSTTEDRKTKADKLKKLKLHLFDATTASLGLLVPLIGMKVGFGNIENCPANWYIPYLVYYMSMLSLSILLYAYNQVNVYGIKEYDRTVIKVSSAMLAFLWLIEAGQFYLMDASFDSSAENYCDLRLYIFTVFMNIFLVLGFAIGGSLLFLDPEVFEYERRASWTNDDDDDEWLLTMTSI